MGSFGADRVSPGFGLSDVGVAEAARELPALPRSDRVRQMRVPPSFEL